MVDLAELPSVFLQVSRLGFGCGGLTGIFNAPVAEEAGIAIIKDAFNKGITFFDTADFYGLGTNEILVGKALKQLPREKIQLATKFGIAKYENDVLEIKGTPDYVRACCEASLARLGVECIDLYYQHRVDLSVPIEDTMGELKKLVKEGKVKYIGLSEASPDTIRRAHAVHPSLLFRWSGHSGPVISRRKSSHSAGTLAIGIVTYSPLGSGFFAGKASVESLPAESILAYHPRFSGDNLEKNKILHARLRTWLQGIIAALLS
ncbi:probable aldo-keto reductase 1 [Elaeis guineensis]|uniref:probable aldo-keto reductase 1 n=1 Tax=Elaeis guineensis var. tenera TaxID=51953 RepID=UPI003C6D402A